MNSQKHYSSQTSVMALTDSLRALHERQNRPTLKLARVLPCNQYVKVIVANGEGAWTGQVVTHLSLEDWCLLHGYRLWVKGEHLYAEPDGSVKTRLITLEVTERL